MGRRKTTRQNNDSELMESTTIEHVNKKSILRNRLMDELVNLYPVMNSSLRDEDTHHLNIQMAQLKDLWEQIQTLTLELEKEYPDCILDFKNDHYFSVRREMIIIKTSVSMLLEEEKKTVTKKDLNSLDDYQN